MRTYILTLLGLITVALFAFGAGPALAKDDAKAAATKPAATSPKEAWATRCEKVKLDEKKPEQDYCEVFQNLSMVKKGEDGKQSAQRLAEFAIGYPPNQKKARGVLVLPLGVLVEEAMSMQIDGKQDVSFRVRYCTPEGCFAFLTMPDSVLDKMSKGEKLTVKGKAFTGQNLEIVISLAGFSKALAKVKPQG